MKIILVVLGLLVGAIPAFALPPGNGQCVSRDFSVTNAPAAFGSAGADLTFPTSVTGIRGAEFDNYTANEMWVSVSTSATNCTGGRGNVAVPANASRFLNPGDQKFGSHICAIRRDGVALTTGTFTACIR